MRLPFIQSEVKITLIIFFLGVVWIIGSDCLLIYLSSDKGEWYFRYGEIGKGIFFMCIMSISLYFLLQHHNKKLKESYNRYLGLFKHNPNAMWIADIATGKIIAANVAACSMYLYKEQEFIQKNIQDIVVKKVSDNFTFNKPYPNDPIFSDAGIWEVAKKDNTIIQVRYLSHTLIYNNQNCYVTLTEDVSHVLKQNKKIEDIAFKNSHIVRKPVANILGIIQLMKQQQNATANNELLTMLETSAHELDNVIKGIAQDVH